MKKSKKQSRYLFFRKLHLYCFGYFQWLTLLASLLVSVIVVTGILYNHQHDLVFLEKGRISTQFLPDMYQERLERVQKAQGLEGLFLEEKSSIPVIWLIKDLHTGDFWGIWGRVVYDILCSSLLVMVITGCYLFLKVKQRTKKTIEERDI